MAIGNSTPEHPEPTQVAQPRTNRPRPERRRRTWVVPLVAIFGPLLVLALGSFFAFLYVSGGLCGAVARGNTTLVKALLTLGANPNAPDSAPGGPPLAVATALRRTDMVRLLIDRGADVNAQDRVGRTALDTATDYYLGDMARVLLRARATPTFPAVVVAGDAEAVRQWLAQGASVRSRDAQQATPLHWAARNGRIDVMRVLLDHGADINATDRNQGTALCWAAGGGHADAVELLIAQGAALASEHVPMQNPLFSAADALQDVTAPGEAARVLLEHGVNPNAQDKDGDTPLHYAARSRRLDVAAALLLHKANPNAQDAQGRTPLHMAAQQLDAELVRLLLANGADPNAHDAHGFGPWVAATSPLRDWHPVAVRQAYEAKQAEVRRLLVEYGRHGGR